MDFFYAARLTDLHTCLMFTGAIPNVGGPVTAPRASAALIGGLPASRLSDMAVLCVGPPDSIIVGELRVLVGRLHCAW
jgi:uncharacterized Zn-binding protein involved in type VI secretion